MNIFQQRRERLYQDFDQQSVIIIVGNTQKVRSKNIKYHFRPDNDLFYYTGFEEPNAVAVLRPHHKEPFAMFVRGKDVAAEVSFGERAGELGVQEKFGADIAYDIEKVYTVLPHLLEERTKVYYLDEQEEYANNILSWIAHQRRNTGFDVIKHYRQLLPFQPYIHNQRVIKDEVEISRIRHAVEASVHAHKQVMKKCRPGMNEGQLAALFDFEIASFGCKEVSYPSIVAGGRNGCCLHYENNNCELNNGEMLLIDAGAEYQYYCADITRTYPINGKFSDAQKTIYQLVLLALDSAISNIKPGVSWNGIYQTCVEVMTKGLIELGILKCSFEQAIASEAYRKFTVHKTGHWLGMDVHDVGAYHDAKGEWRLLQENMVFTVEPGIYIPEDCLDVEEKWRGIAVRIEDDILVTADGCENLSSGVPRTVEEIEAWMAD